jgi:hypothetical protein
LFRGNEPKRKGEFIYNELKSVLQRVAKNESGVVLQDFFLIGFEKQTKQNKTNHHSLHKNGTFFHCFVGYLYQIDLNQILVFCRSSWEIVH